MELTAFRQNNARVGTKYLRKLRKAVATARYVAWLFALSRKLKCLLCCSEEVKSEDYKMTVDIYEGNEIIGTNKEVLLEFTVGGSLALQVCIHVSEHSLCCDVQLT